MYSIFGFFLHIEFWDLFYLLLCSHKGAVAIRQPYIRVVGIEDANDANSRGPAAFTQEEVIVKFIQRFFTGKNNIFSILRMYVYYEVPVAIYFCVTN